MLFFKVKKRRVRHYHRTQKSKAHFNAHKENARVLVHERLQYWNQFYNFRYGRVAIRNQGTRWGSCSTLGNLNFNYRIALIPTELADYIIVHELCHLKEFNHAQAFWNLVGETIPNYIERKNKLQAMSIMLISDEV